MVNWREEQVKKLKREAEEIIPPRLWRFPLAVEGV
jgi:hypothetical protein